MKTPLKIIAKEHFWVSGLKRAFVITGVIPLYVHVRDNYDDLEKNTPMEFFSNGTTFVYEIDKNEIKLITAWTGSRK
jgi:hypothetical protein